MPNTARPPKAINDQVAGSGTTVMVKRGVLFAPKLALLELSINVPCESDAPPLVAKKS